MNPVPEHVASLISTIFEAGAGGLRARGESASAFLVRHSDTEFTMSLEVSREGGDWQRNLVATIDAAGSVWEVEVRITDEEARTVARVGEVSTALEDLGEIGLAMARVGVARLAGELTPPVMAARA